MQRPTSIREAEQQTAGGIFVFRIIFDDCNISPGLNDLLIRNISLNGSPESVAAEFELTLAELAANLDKSLHTQSSATPPIFFNSLIAFLMRLSTFFRPITAMDSNSGGLTGLPVTAARMMANTCPAL